MYKEYTDSAFNLWRTSGKQTVGDYFADGPGVKEAIKKFQVEIKEFKAKEAALLAKAEEDGEELAYEIRTSQWRYSVPGLTLPGESLEAAEHDVKNVINYDGGLQPQ
ncbi:hypothetical protein CEUSTIGMA_g13866.t1 [Chlamydomonas eustigma]|uniref:Uncharacterized protein n=1 Tax=Chlamydomonas eustigma TaxID=1157962 RepID=A0A250XTU0_9CHLO|nr:hypothetical protein CEUSTIGMA_g13866.t1 [Chlamydomonas eustigma]|eukprot:GAX86456.1 hypothetical protein CEUSTIGMA_g13866.t1 [Chlamydomonas eustigma]